MADSSPKEKAKKNLMECFRRCWPGSDEHWPQESIDFIDSITDSIIEAAVDEVKAQLKISMVASGGVLGAFMSGAGYWIIDRFCNPKKNEDDEPNPL